MLRYPIPIVLLGIACSDPTGPHTGAQRPTGPGRISFVRLAPGDSLVVDQQSVGCFMRSDAHLIFVGTQDGAIVSGVLVVNGRTATIPVRPVTYVKLAGLENLHQLYRQEEHQTRCMSTGHHSTTFRSTGGATEHYETDGCIEEEILGEGPSLTIRQRPDIVSLYEFTKPGYDAVLRQS